MTELEASGVGDAPPSYMIFLVVFLFFLTGLLGFLICQLLKKKGYRCRTGEMDDEEEEEEEEKLGGHADEEHEENQDTVEQILKCIIENEANMEAFNEMLGNHNVCVRHDPRLRKESIGGVPPHLHTVHSGTDHNTCHLCAQVRSKKARRHSRTPRSKQRPGEQTVFSVGRFRVTHTDKKLPGSPNPLNISRDQLDQSQDSVERKEGGYHLRSLFKDSHPPSENGGVAANVGKRRKSLTIFGLRRGSDPIGIKLGEGIGKETGGVKFAIQQQPVVLEETLQAENPEVECDSKPSYKSKTKPSSPECEVKPSGAVNSPSSQSKTQDAESGSGLKTNIKLSSGSAAPSAPSSLPISTYKTKEVYSPGPIQTSTPIAPISGSIPGFTPVIPTTQPGPYSSTDLPVTQSPPDPSSSPDREPGFGANLALISLGSSPPSSFPVKTLSSTSSLKTPTSPLAVTPSPKLSPRNTTTEAKTTFSAGLTPSPKLLPGQEMSSQSPILSSASPMQASSPSPAHKHDGTALNQQDIEGAARPKTEVKRPGILKTSKPSPAASEDTKSSAFSSPSDQLFKDRLSILPSSPSSPLSPSSPQGSRISSVTIVKASPDSKREFSVVTMVEEEESSTSTKDQKGETSEVSQVGKNSISGDGHLDSQSGDMCGEEVRSVLRQEKDDMVEMEDIRDCKVTKVEGVEKEGEKMLSTQSKQDS